MSPQRETIPDEVVRRADQIEIVDIAPEALQRRMAHGNIYPPGAGRRGPDQLLPGRQPVRAARARPAVGGRAGRRGTAALPRRPRDRPAVGGPRADRRRRCPVAPRARRCCGARSGSPPGRPARTCWPCTSSGATAWPGRPGGARPAASPRRVDGRHVAPGRGRRRRRRAPRLRAGGERHPDRDRRQQPRPLGVVPGRRRDRGPGHPAVGSHRRPPGHPRGGVGAGAPPRCRSRG